MATKQKSHTGIATPHGPLHSPAGKIWLTGQLARAEHEAEHGPEGSWQHNEALRPALEERAAFLRALVALLN